jgi:hypothetical protein
MSRICQLLKEKKMAINKKYQKRIVNSMAALKNVW